MEIYLWQRRSEQRFSLTQLSERTSISRSTLNNIENYRVSPTIKQLEAIAMALDIGIVDLFASEYKYGNKK